MPIVFLLNGRRFFHSFEYCFLAVASYLFQKHWIGNEERQEMKDDGYPFDE